MVIKLLFIKIKFSQPPIDFENNNIFLETNGIKRLLRKNDKIPGLELSVSGFNNKVIIEYPQDLKSLSIKINGNNNIIQVSKAESIRSSTIFIRGNNNNCIIEKTKKIIVSLQIDLLRKFDNRTIHIKEDSGTMGTHFTISSDGRKIVVGKSCTLSWDTKIWTTDWHIILDKKSGKRINYDKDVCIGNHVWICNGASVFKGVTIPDGCIIGAYSIVNKSFTEPNTIIAGIPAKVVKRDIEWEL